MPLDIPESALEVENRAKTDVQRELPESNPFNKNSWLGALITSYSNRVFDFYIQLRIAIDQSFADKATGEFLERLAAIYGLQRLPATQSSGNVVAIGTATSNILNGTVLTSSVGNFITTSTVTISDQIINVLSITRSGQIATVTTQNAHNLANNVPVDIAGALETEYNVTGAEITVTGLNTFEYNVSGTPATPATGTITAAFTSARVPILSDDFGSQTNLDAGQSLRLQSPIVGVDDTFVVDFGAIGGGVDQETDDQLRSRLLDRIQNPVAHFNVSDIVSTAKEVPGVTRVFVEEAGAEVGTISLSSLTRSGNVATATSILPHGFDDGMNTTITGAAEGDYNVVDKRIIVESATIFHFVVLGTPSSPATGIISASALIPLGVVRVFFTRDNDEDIIPTASEVQTVKDKLNTILPANTSTQDLIVRAPASVTVNFTFTDLSPNTPSMQSAVTSSLNQFFRERTTVGVNIDEDSYRSAIFNTVDTQTGDVVQTFSLSSPSGDITINSGEIGVIGSVIYP